MLTVLFLIPDCYLLKSIIRFPPLEFRNFYYEMFYIENCCKFTWYDLFIKTLNFNQSEFLLTAISDSSLTITKNPRNFPINFKNN